MITGLDDWLYSNVKIGGCVYKVQYASVEVGFSDVWESTYDGSERVSVDISMNTLYQGLTGEAKTHS